MILDAMSQQPPTYTRPAVVFHWIIFVLLVIGWSLGSYMSDLPFSPQKLRYVSWHKWLGVTIFLIAAGRLAWRLTHGVPPMPSTVPRWQQRAAVVVHALLYIHIIAIPITGWLFSSAAGVPTVYLGLVQLPDVLERSKNLADVLRSIHGLLNWSLLVIVIGHTGFALKHHFVDRDDVLRRMLPIRRSPWS